MAPAALPGSSLSPSHPLILELGALRAQLAQYQHASHQTAIQLQGSRLELSLAKDQTNSLSSALKTLQAEVETLRAHPAPPPLKPDSTALSELSLAHRRLSAKLDITEEHLSACKLELAAAQQEITRLGKERDNDRATINEFRRAEDERGEELIWERGERRKVEEQKKLCDLALKEYSVLVQSLDPSAVPPQTPDTAKAVPSILSTPPSLHDGSIPDPPILPAVNGVSHTPQDTSEHVSHLLQGQQGVHQLVNDFVSTMTLKEKETTRLSLRVEELELSLSSVTKQLEEETALRVACLEERDKVLRDDGSAAKVVERYMTFTQKTHATIHLHLDNLRARSGATQASLRQENMEYQTRLRIDKDRILRLGTAMNEVAEALSRETAGRRREVALRLKMITADEKRERKVEKWLDRVRRAREGAEGAFLEPDALEVLVDEGVEAVAEERTDVEREKRPAWKGLLSRKRAPSVTTNGEESSITRVLLAEDLVNTLVQDLQIETERRIDLERQRMTFLANEAAGGQAAEEDGPDLLVFDAERDATPTPAELEPNTTTDERAPSPSPLVQVGELRQIFVPLHDRYSPLQTSLHSLGHSLASLRASLPDPTTPISPILPPRFATRKNFPTLNLRRPPPLADPVLLTVLENLHEVIEDARVDVEIALADEERVYRGFEALLTVGKAGAVQNGEVTSDASEYVQDRMSGDVFGKLRTRVSDIEEDLAVLKERIMAYQGAGAPDEDAPNEATDAKDRKFLSTRSIWSDIPLKTVSPVYVHSVSPLGTPLESPSSSPRPSPMAVMGNMGRSFSAGIIGAPRKVSGFAGGLYRPGRRKEGQEGKLEKEGLMRQDTEEDVE